MFKYVPKILVVISISARPAHLRQLVDHHATNSPISSFGAAEVPRSCVPLLWGVRHDHRAGCHRVLRAVFDLQGASREVLERTVRLILEVLWSVSMGSRQGTGGGEGDCQGVWNGGKGRLAEKYTWQIPSSRKHILSQTSHGRTRPKYPVSGDEHDGIPGASKKRCKPVRKISKKNRPGVPTAATVLTIKTIGATDLEIVAIAKALLLFVASPVAWSNSVVGVECASRPRPS